WIVTNQESTIPPWRGPIAVQAAAPARPALAAQRRLAGRETPVDNSTRRHPLTPFGCGHQPPPLPPCLHPESPTNRSFLPNVIVKIAQGDLRAMSFLGISSKESGADSPAIDPRIVIHHRRLAAERLKHDEALFFFSPANILGFIGTPLAPSD